MTKATGYVERYRISIQVFLNGYSYKVTDSDGNTILRKDDNAVEDLYSSHLFSYKYEEYELSFRTHECTLIPERMLHGWQEGDAGKKVLREALSEYTPLEDDREIAAIGVPYLKAVLVYALPGKGSSLNALLTSLPAGCRPLPEMYWMLEQLHGTLKCHNRVIASYRDSLLTLLISEDDSLLLCNSFEAPDFTTALYFLFSSMKQFQFNPEVTTVYFRNSLSQEQQMLLYRYFSGVEVLE